MRLGMCPVPIDRWWTARQEIESVTSDVISLAMMAKIMDIPSWRRDREAARAHQRRLFLLLEALLDITRQWLVEDGRYCEVYMSLSLYIYTHIYVYISLSLYIYTCICMCICICKCK